MTPNTSDCSKAWSEEIYATPLASPSRSENVSAIVTTIQEVGSSYGQSESSSNHEPLEFEPNTQKILRGGFAPLEKEDVQPPKLNAVKFRAYPPPANSAYELTSDARIPEIKRKRDENILALSNFLLPKANSKPEQKPGYQRKLSDTIINYETKPHYDGPDIFDNIRTGDVWFDPFESHEPEPEFDAKNCVARNVVPYYNPSKPKTPVFEITQYVCTDNSDFDPFGSSVPEEPVNLEGGLTKGEVLARTINWNRPAWVNTVPGVSGVLYPPEEMRADFVRNIDAGAKLLYCKICNKRHIPPGPPITLQDRDTCYTFLPDWFPTDVENPWDAFIHLFNELAILNEIEMGYSHRPDPSKPEWDYEFHEKHPKWGQIGRRGNTWWKCRSGLDAPSVERTCRLCHKPKTPEEMAAAAQRNIPAAEKKKIIMDWIETKMKQCGDLDRAIVMGREHGQGVVDILSPKLTPQQDETIEDDGVVGLQREFSALDGFKPQNFPTDSYDEFDAPRFPGFTKDLAGT